MTISGDLKLLSTTEYPDEDFEPMPEGDKQRRNLSYTTEALRLWFEKQPNFYVSDNLTNSSVRGLSIFSGTKTFTV
ncbi:hypothetical protein TUMEXPCC7403_24820 [Tumidithrix helvetica PCC 7403]|uniref:hypothetical protein n=1 Tax=Tumidithrix helvetica TaxID=3457545 RepID=UPI003C8C7932